MTWAVGKIPDQTGTVVVVTGANRGIGFETARVLAERGARVILACRSMDRGRAAIEQILNRHADATVESATLDTSSLASVRACARHLCSSLPRLDCLINNAGIMAVPRATTADGFELQLATNHLGHFGLTGLLFPLLLKARAPRVVTVSSAMHRFGRMDFDDLHGERRYSRWRAYAQSKLANLLFSRELQRRCNGQSAMLVSTACHPGYVSTQLQSRAAEHHVGPIGWGMNAARRIFAQDPGAGALSLLFAATASVDPGEYYGPRGPLGLTGAPGPAPRSARAEDDAVAARLWATSEELTDVRFP